MRNTTKNPILSTSQRSSLSYLPLILGLAILPSLAQSANPFSFDQNGNIVAPCPPNFTCSTNTISGPGILQRSVVDSAGNRFIQSIIADVDVLNTTTSTESFISINGENGISVSQHMAYTKDSDFLTTLSDINTGWANTGDQPAIVLNQSFSLTFRDVVNTDGSFIYEADYDSEDNMIGEYIDVTQRVEGSSLLTANPTTGVDIQAAVYRRASGTRVTTSGSLVLPSSGMGMMGGGMMGGGSGGTSSWSAGDEITVFWVGQICDGCIAGGMMGGGMGGRGMMGGGMGGGSGGDVIFSYQEFDNLSNTLRPISTLTLEDPDPFDWDPALGTEPILQ